MMKALQICLIVTALGLAGSWSDNSRASEFNYPITRITDKIQVVYGPFDLPDKINRGFRNNIVVVHTTKGLVIFDPGGSAYAGEWVAKTLRSQGKLPIVAVFDSHAHGDHWLGNEGIKRIYPNTIIYGHPKMKGKVEGADGDRWLRTINRLTEGAADGEKVIAPDMTVKDGDVIVVGDTKFRIYYAGRAHTDNDIMIEVVGENALFVGDVVRNGLLGIMEDDANFEGNIAAIDFIIQKNFRHYIPGHGKVGSVEIPKKYRAYLATLRKTVKDLYGQGLADFEMKPKVVNAVKAYKNWAGFDIRVGAHISRAYLEIEAEAF